MRGPARHFQACLYDPSPMLPRLPHTQKVGRPSTRTGQAASCGHLREWLQAPGSLTARLRQHGRVTVKVLRQGRQTLWPQERLALRQSQGHVREVLLLVNGRVAVWARSSTPLRAVKGPWRAIKGLGSRPLAELLFERQRVQRDALIAQHLAKTSPQSRHLQGQWPAGEPAPQWARHSVFWRHGQPLQVMEAFAPWVAGCSPTARPVIDPPQP